MPEGIEIELKGFIDKIRRAFPDAKVLTERVTQDIKGEVFFLEEGNTIAKRELTDTFNEETTYHIYFRPNITDLSRIQTRIREVRRWEEQNLMWMPFVKHFVYESSQDTLHTTFSLWRRYRLIPDPETKMVVLMGDYKVTN